MYIDLLDTIKDEVSTYILWIACTALPQLHLLASNHGVKQYKKSGKNWFKID